MDPGPILLVVAMLLGIPALLAGGMVLAAIIGWRLDDEAKAEHAGSEFIDLNY